MKLVPLAGPTEAAVRVALLSHGWEGDLSFTTSRGLESLVFEVRGLSAGALLDLVTGSARLGLDVITGPDWAILSGSRARLSALARPWVVPESLTDLAVALGHALPAEETPFWQVAGARLELDRPVLMGILNITPDSFSDGGRYSVQDAALPRAGELLAAGATILDVGGESTRPGAEPVSEAEELERVVPVIRAVAERFPEAVISIDTTKLEVARQALDAGAGIVNDVSGLRLAPGIGSLCAERGAGGREGIERAGVGQFHAPRQARKQRHAHPGF